MRMRFIIFFYVLYIYIFFFFLIEFDLFQKLKETFVMQVIYIYLQYILKGLIVFYIKIFFMALLFAFMCINNIYIYIITFILKFPICIICFRYLDI